MQLNDEAKRKTTPSKTKRTRYRLNFELIYGKKKKRKSQNDY